MTYKLGYFCLLSFLQYILLYFPCEEEFTDSLESVHYGRYYKKFIYLDNILSL